MQGDRIDIMPKMVEQAKASSGERQAAPQSKSPSWRAMHGSCPSQTGSLNTVLVESVTIFVEDVAKAIGEYNRVLKPGGALCDNEVCITRKSTEELKGDIKDLEAIFTPSSSKTDRGILTHEDWRDIYQGQFRKVDAEHFIADPKAESMAKEERRLRCHTVDGESGLPLLHSTPDAKSDYPDHQEHVQVMPGFRVRTLRLP